MIWKLPHVYWYPPPKERGKAKELFDRISKFKSDLAKIDTGIAKFVIPNLPLDLRIPKTETIPKNDDEKESWGYGYFHMTPSIASITIMSKFQNDVRNSEAQVVEYVTNKLEQ